MVIKTKRYYKNARRITLATVAKYKTLKGGNYPQTHNKPQPPRVFKYIDSNVAKQMHNYKSGRSKKRPPKTAASDWRKKMISSPITQRVNSANGTSTLTNTQRENYIVNTVLVNNPNYNESYSQLFGKKQRPVRINNESNA